MYNQTFPKSHWYKFTVSLAMCKISFGPYGYLHLVLLVIFILTISMDYYIVILLWIHMVTKFFLICLRITFWIACLSFLSILKITLSAFSFVPVRDFYIFFIQALFWFMYCVLSFTTLRLAFLNCLNGTFWYMEIFNFNTNQFIHFFIYVNNFLTYLKKHFSH